MGRRINPIIFAGDIVGRCPKCKSDFTGFLSAQMFIEGLSKIKVQMNCGFCDHFGNYFVNASELPPISLRHVSNGQKVGARSKVKKKKKRPSDVLKGQLPLPGVL